MRQLSLIRAHTGDIIAIGGRNNAPSINTFSVLKIGYLALFRCYFAVFAQYRAVFKPPVTIHYKGDIAPYRAHLIINHFEIVAIFRFSRGRYAYQARFRGFYCPLDSRFGGAAALRNGTQ